MGWAGLLSIMTAPAFAQGSAPSSDTTDCPKEVAAIATCYTAKHPSGAYLLAAIPNAWNGNLIVFAHGGPAVVPPTANTSKNDLAKYSIAVERGFGWVASSYRRPGYGVQMAVEDTEQARQFFVERIRQPRRTIVHGASYGGLVAAKLIEKQFKKADGSSAYDGAFLNSGLVIGAARAHDFRFDLRMVYQYFCKNLPRPDEPQYPLWNGLPAGAKVALKDIQGLVDECTGVTMAAGARSPQQKQHLANILGVMRFPEALLLRHMQSATFLFREIVERTTGGRNAYSNVGVTYKGSTDDAALNRDVARFAADPAAVAALKADGEPTGAISIPVISIHSMNDPQVAVEVQTAYRNAVNAAGNGERLVQAYTDERGHTQQSKPELAASLDALMQWIEQGTKPSPQSIASTCQRLRVDIDGPCRWHPEFMPKAYETRYARGAGVSAELSTR
jgi:alpha-beta hydrolase superfamily lysophospholipase